MAVMLPADMVDLVSRMSQLMSQRSAAAKRFPQPLLLNWTEETTITFGPEVACKFEY